MIRNIFLVMSLISTLTVQGLLAGLLFFYSTHSLAKKGDNTYNEFSKTDDKMKALSFKNLKSRFELTGEAYVSDKSGRLLYQLPQTRQWVFSDVDHITSYWSYNGDGGDDFHIKHVWKINTAGNIEIHIQQFDGMSRKDGKKTKTGKLLKQKKLQLRDFSPVTWVALDTGKKRLTVRFVPKLKGQNAPIKMSQVPITLNDAVIYDSTGKIWAPDVTVDATYMGIKTGRGIVAISYFPFKGAREIGIVEGNKLILRVNSKLKINIKSTNPILTSNKTAKVYGFIDLKNKYSHRGSVGISAGDVEKDFLKELPTM